MTRPGRVDALGAAILRHRWPVVALATLVVLAVAAGAGSITVSNDYRDMFHPDNPQLAAFDALERTYSVSNPVIVAVAPRRGTVFTAATLGAIAALTEALWTAPHSSRVDSLANHMHSEAAGDDLVVEPLVGAAASLDRAALARIERIALGTPEIAGRLVSRDAKVAGVVINFVLPDDPAAAVAEIAGHLDGLLEAERLAHPGLDYYAAGEIYLNRAFTRATENDFRTLAPLALALIVALTWLLIRSLPATLAIVVVVLFATGATMGFAGWTGATITPISANVPIIVMAITVAHCIHVVTRTLAGMRRGMDKGEAIRESLRGNAGPVFLTSLTTAIGFLSLNAADAPPFRTLGNLAAFGVLCAFVFAMTVLPAALSLLPVRARAAGRGRAPWIERLGAFVVARRAPVLCCLAAIACALAFGIPRNELSDNFVHYFDERFEVRRHADFITGNLTGLATQEYSLDAGRETGITDPGYLRSIDRFARWYRAQPEVQHVWVFSDVMKRLNMNLHGDDPQAYRLPDDAALAAQYLLLYELSLPFGRDLNHRIDIAKSATRMVATLHDVSSREQRALARRAGEWLRAELPGLATEASGLSVVFAHIAQRNIESMLRGTVVAMGLISLILVIVFRSVRAGLVSLVPNFVPAVMSFGLWGYLAGNVGIASAVVTVIAFGIVVDDTIHFMSRYVKARKERGCCAAEAVRATFREVGDALWTTTAVLCAGFLVFALSGFQASWTLGVLVAMTLSFALLTDFLLLPTLLMAIDRKRT